MADEYLKNKRILLVDDERELLRMVVSILSEDGFTNVVTAENARDAVARARERQPELAILDVNLPDLDGFSLMARLRSAADYPVLFLSARGEDDDRFRGFSIGADDYIVKPFLPRELLFRVKAILRRCYKPDDPVIKLDFCEIDLSRAEVTRSGERIPLTAKEHELISALWRNSGRIVTIDALCEALWGENPYGYESSLMAHVRRIREKIERDPSKPVSLVTVKGLGYKLITEGK